VSSGALDKPRPKHRPAPREPTIGVLSHLPPVSVPPAKIVPLGGSERAGSEQGRGVQPQSRRERKVRRAPVLNASPETIRSEQLDQKLADHRAKYGKIADDRRRKALAMAEERAREATALAAAAAKGGEGGSFLRRMSSSVFGRSTVQGPEIASRAGPSRAPVRTGARSGAEYREERLRQPAFIESVVAMMGDPKTVAVFVLFDSDGSGEIDLAEMRKLILMVSPDTVAGEVESMVQELDINKDGAVDLWCAKRRSRDSIRIRIAPLGLSGQRVADQQNTGCSADTPCLERNPAVRYPRHKLGPTYRRTGQSTCSTRPATHHSCNPPTDTGASTHDSTTSLRLLTT